jgi:hypothetical protein
VFSVVDDDGGIGAIRVVFLDFVSRRSDVIPGQLINVDVLVLHIEGFQEFFCLFAPTASAERKDFDVVRLVFPWDGLTF